MVVMQISDPLCLISDTGTLLGKLLVPDLPDHSYLIYGDVPYCGMFTTPVNSKQLVQQNQRIQGFGCTLQIL